MLCLSARQQRVLGSSQLAQAGNCALGVPGSEVRHHVRQPGGAKEAQDAEGHR